MIEALISHQYALLTKGISTDEKTLSLISNGLKDKRIKVKCAWAVSVSNAIWDVDNPREVTDAFISFSSALAKSLSDILNETAGNAVQAVQNGTIIAAYAISAVMFGRWLEWRDEKLGNVN